MLCGSWASRLCVCTVYLLAAGVFKGAAYGADNNTPLWLHNSVLQTRLEVDVSAAVLNCLLVEESGGSTKSEAVGGGDASRSYLSLQQKIDRKSQKSPRALAVAVEMATIAGRFAKLGSVHVQGFYRTEVYVSATLQALVVKHTPFAGLQTFLDVTATDGTDDDTKSTSMSTWTIFNNVEDYLSENYRGNYSGWFSAVTLDSSNSPSVVHQFPTHWTRLMAASSAPGIRNFSCSSTSSGDTPTSAPRSAIPFKTLEPYVTKQCNSASELLNRWELKQQVRAPGAFEWLMDALCHFDLEFTLRHQSLAGSDDRVLTQDRALAIGGILSRLHQLSYEHALASVIGFQALQYKVGAPVRGKHGVLWPLALPEKVLLNAVEVLVDTMYMAHLYQEALGCLDWLLDLDSVMHVEPGDQWVRWRHPLEIKV